MKKIVFIALITIAVLAISFLATAGLVWLVCWAFGFTWSWKVCVGIYAVILLVSSAVKSHGAGSKQ